MISRPWESDTFVLIVNLKQHVLSVAFFISQFEKREKNENTSKTKLLPKVYSYRAAGQKW